VAGPPTRLKTFASTNWLAPVRMVSKEADVLVGPGSKELIFLLQIAYAGDLVIPNPAWVSYAPQARIVGRTASLGMPGRLFLRLCDAAGKTLAEAPQAVPARRVLEYTATADAGLLLRVDELQRRLDGAVRGRTRFARDRLGTIAAGLQALSPLEVLARGYSMTLSGDGDVIRGADQVTAGDEIVTVFSRGRAVSRIESIDVAAEPPGLDSQT